jgi:uncharacterized membrane protein YdjX (TVP38/TMEM64 family)
MDQTPSASPAEASAASSAAPKLGRVRRFLKRIGPAGPMAIIVTCLPAIGAIFLFAIASRVTPWLAAKGIVGAMIFAAAFAILGGFALVPTYANSILGGWMFKFALGFPIVLVGLGGAAMIGYVLAHRIIGHRVEEVIAEHPKWEIVRRALVGESTMKTIGIVTLLRLSPLLPFETTTLLLAMCGVRAMPFLVGTILGVAPRAAVIVFAGAAAHKLELHAAPHPAVIVIGLLLTAASVIIIAVIAKHALDRATGAGSTRTIEDGGSVQM